MIYRIWSRTSPKFQWKIVTAAPHGERYKFDMRDRLYFDDIVAAEQARQHMSKANAAEYIVVQDGVDPNRKDVRAPEKTLQMVKDWLWGSQNDALRARGDNRWNVMEQLETLLSYAIERGLLK